MPALPSVPNVIKAVLRFTISEAIDAIVTNHLSYSGTAPTDSILDTVATAIASAFTANIAELFTSDRNLTEVTLTDLTSPTSAVGTWVGSIDGTRTDVELPAATCAVWQRHVGRRYRGGHSRQYWPAGGDTALQDAQTWNHAFTTAFATQMEAFETAVVNLTWTGGGFSGFVNVSYYSGFTNVLYPSGRYHVKPTLRTTPVVDPITTNNLNPKLGSQRRRNLQSS